jgi:hypothetical protein
VGLGYCGISLPAPPKPLKYLHNKNARLKGGRKALFA